MQRLIQSALCVFALSASLWAQSEAGGATVAGTVTDPTGAAVVAAKVTLNSEQTGFTRVFETNASGAYSFQRVPVGRYNLTLEKTGFKSVKRTDIDLSVGAVATLDIALQVGSTSESITVSGEVPLVETTRSQTSTNVNDKSVSDLPINGRNFLNFTLLTPGVNMDPRGGDLSFGGQRGTANSLLVDGMDSNNLFFGQSAGRAGSGRNPYSFSQDAVEEFQVNANGFAAEIGRAGGGVINVVTKSGSNQVHGNAFWYFRDREMNANTFLNKSRGIVRQPYHYNQFGGTVGGPVKKDKVFFFLSYDGQRNLNPNPVFFPFAAPSDAASQAAASELSKYLTSYTTGYNNDIGLAKVDWNLSNTDRLSVRTNLHRFRGQNFENSGSQSAAEHTGNSLVSTSSVAVNYNKVLGSAMVLDSRLNFVKDDEPGEANSTAPETTVLQNGSNYIIFGRNNFSPRYTNAKRTQWAESLSYLRGKHSFKFGADLNFERIDNFFPGNFSGVYRFNSLADYYNRKPAQFTQSFAGDGTAGALTKPNINEFAFFAQDSWRATDRLTLNYGYRYDQQRFDQPSVLNPNAGLLAQGLATDRVNHDTNNHAPRFGFAYRLDSEGKQAVRGGYGVFYGRTPSILVGTAFSQNGIQVQTYTLTANLPAYPAILSAPPSSSRTPDIYVTAPDYVQPLTAQWNVNYEAQLSKDYAVTVGYLGVRGYHLSRTRDINLYPLAAESASFADGSPTTIYTRPATRPNASFGRISLFDSGADSVYHGVFFQATKRLSRNFQFLANYTFSKVIDSVPDATSVVVGSDDTKVAQDTLNPNRDRAVGNANVPHRVVFSGVWDLNYWKGSKNPLVAYVINGWQISGIFNGRSGMPYSASLGGNADINRDGNTRNDRPPALGRNTYKLPGVYTLDARVSKVIPLWRESVRLRMVGEAFNLLNRANWAGVNTSPYNYNSTTKVFTPVATFQTASSALDPRILQVALKLEF